MADIVLQAAKVLIAPAVIAEDAQEVTDHAAVLEKVETAVRPVESAARKIFSQFENLLGNETRTRWTKIVATQVGAAPWIDLIGCC